MNKKKTILFKVKDANHESTIEYNFADDKKSKELVNNLSNINESVEVIGKERPKISENIGNQKLYGSNDDINILKQI